MNRYVPRVLFVNSGILGHRVVASLMARLTAGLPLFRAEHINLSEDLTIPDRAIRRVLSFQMAPTIGPAGNLDLRRWRQELNVGWLAARRIRAAEKRIAPDHFDVLHFHTQPTAYASLARMRRTPSIVSIDAGPRLAMEGSSSRLSRASHRAGVLHDGAVFRRARAIVSTSAWAARDVAALSAPLADKLRVMPYPIDLGPFDASWAAERAARTDANPAPMVRALFVGGDFPRKGGVELLNAWHEGGFAARAMLDVVTDWPLAPDDLPPGVNLVRGVLPYSATWRELWRRADLFVMPTKHEAFGMVFQEAAAAAIPAIGTDIHAIPEIVKDGITGLLVRPDDPGSLVRALHTLIASPVLRIEMGRAARCQIAAVANPSAYASKLSDLILSLVQPHAHDPA